MSSAASSQRLWPGPLQREGVDTFREALSEGMSVARSLVLGVVASFRDCFMFQRRIAEICGCSVRTVQRALHEGRERAFIECHHSKPNETPPGLARGTRIPCGWSHRWIVGRGLSEPLRLAARAIKKSARTVVGRAKGTMRTSTSRRQWTAAEIDAELARRHAVREQSRWTPAEFDAELARRDAARAPPRPK
jgi:hypothetical protein